MEAHGRSLACCGCLCRLPLHSGGQHGGAVDEDWHRCARQRGIDGHPAGPAGDALAAGAMGGIGTVG